MSRVISPVFAWIGGVLVFVIIGIVGVALFPLWNTTVTDLGTAGIPVVSAIAAAANGGLFNTLYGVGVLVGGVAAAAIIIRSVGGVGGGKK